MANLILKNGRGSILSFIVVQNPENRVQRVVNLAPAEEITVEDKVVALSGDIYSKIDQGQLVLVSGTLPARNVAIVNTAIYNDQAEAGEVALDLSLKADIASPTFTGTVVGISKAMVGLTDVDDTADSAKPVSTDQQTALDLKSPIANPTFTGTVAGISKAMVGLTDVDDIADNAKPISTLQQAGLDLKALKSVALSAADSVASDAATATAIAQADSVATVLVDATGDTTVIALANDLKALFNADIVLVNELKVGYTALKADYDQLVIKYDAVVTLANECKAKLDTMNA